MRTIILCSEFILEQFRESGVKTPTRKVCRCVPSPATVRHGEGRTQQGKLQIPSHTGRTTEQQLGGPHLGPGFWEDPGSSTELPPQLSWQEQKAKVKEGP